MAMSAARLLSLSLFAAGCTLADLRSLRGDEYALDAQSRSGACHPEALISYRGTWLKLEPPSAVAVPFAARLERFEEKLAALGHRVYGRAPSQILHVGTYACRATENHAARLSEHALGNAIDVTGFRFPALTQPAPELPPQLRGAFTITVLRDYLPPEKPSATSAVHQRFFALLAAELREHELFRGVIGPPDPDHRTHLHLDMAPWPYERL